jgi:uncharacterized protein YwgA
MTPDQAILAVLATVPGKSVRGKKRLQKLAHLWQASGVEIEVNFKIKYYGPYSREIDNSCALLSLFGDIEEKEIAAGYANYLTTEYSLPTNYPISELNIDDNAKRILAALDNFDTIDLEVASTIVFFLKSGLNLEDSINETRKIKPTKVNQRTIDSANKIVSVLGMN